MSRHIPFEGYDYFDFGCSSGGNLTFSNTVFPGLRGLGIDIDPAKIKLAHDKGHNAVALNILALPDRKLVRFVTMSHFLEHLDSMEMVRRITAKAISVAREFVFIRQPWFDSDGPLFLLGYKFYWSHWKGHRNKMTTLDFHSLLTAEAAKGRIRSFAIFGRASVNDTEDPVLLPILSPIDQQKYRADLHGPKGARKRLPFAAYKEILIGIDIADCGGVDAVLTKLEPSQLLYRAETPILGRAQGISIGEHGD